MKTLKITQTANANLQNRINVSVIFNYVREYGPTYRARIAKDLNISAPAVSRIIEKLIEDGYIRETSKIKTNSGKRPIQLDINSEKGIVLGIDLIKERVKIAVSNFKGHINYSSSGFEISEGIDIKSKTIEEIQRVLNDYSTKFNIEVSNKLKAIGIGVPATVNIQTGDIINAPLFSSLRNFNLKKAVETIFNVPVYIENISKVSALAENKYGVGKGFNDLVFIEISKGIGAGLIINNNIFRGTTGSSGEIGFMITDRDGLHFKKTNEKGYLESKASTEAIIEKVKLAIQKGEHTEILNYINEYKSHDKKDLKDNNIEKIDLNMIFKAFKNDDPLARKIVLNAIDMISIGIINLILVLNPEIVIIGGEICNTKYTELIVDEIQKRARRAIPFSIPPIKISKLGENAGVIGASFLAIESLLLDEFPYFMDYKTDYNN